MEATLAISLPSSLVLQLVVRVVTVYRGEYEMVVWHMTTGWSQFDSPDFVSKFFKFPVLVQPNSRSARYYDNDRVCEGGDNPGRWIRMKHGRPATFFPCFAFSVANSIATFM